MQGLLVQIWNVIVRKDRAMAQAVSRWPLTAAVRVRIQVNPVGFVVDKGIGFSPSPSVFLCRYHSTVGTTLMKIKKIVLPFIHSSRDEQ
jgi:hypothetical protein